MLRFDTLCFVVARLIPVEWKRQKWEPRPVRPRGQLGESRRWRRVIANWGREAPNGVWHITVMDCLLFIGGCTRSSRKLVNAQEETMGNKNKCCRFFFSEHLFSEQVAHSMTGLLRATCSTSHRQAASPVSNISTSWYPYHRSTEAFLSRGHAQKPFSKKKKMAPIHYFS